VKVLAADIGGTKSLLAVFERSGGILRAVREERLETARFPSLAKMVEEFLSRGRGRIDRACFAVAGPVANGRCRAVNLPWAVDGPAVARAIGVPDTWTVNDFESVGHGLVHLRRGDLVTLQRGRRTRAATVALIGAGTGLGEGYLTFGPHSYEVHASEGGHADFAPRNEVEIGLLRFLAARHGHVSYERILSGSGLGSLLAYVQEAGLARAGRRVRAEAADEDPAAVVTRHALLGDDRACVRALDLFLSIYGAEAGNLALKLMSVGGVYVAGGIAPRVLHRLKEGAFLRAFLDKGRHAPILECIPVRVVRNPRVGLIGAAAIAFRADPPPNSWGRTGRHPAQRGGTGRTPSGRSPR
jgi:glucokinase